MTEVSRRAPQRYTTHQVQGFIAFPALLAVLSMTVLQPTTTVIWMLIGATAGWLVVYWALLNQARSRLAFAVLLVLGAGAALVILWIIGGLLGLRLPGADLLDRPIVAVAAAAR